MKYGGRNGNLVEGTGLEIGMFSSSESNNEILTSSSSSGRSSGHIR